MVCEAIDIDGFNHELTLWVGIKLLTEHSISCANIFRSLPDGRYEFDLYLTPSKIKSNGYVGQNGLWIFSDIEKIHHRYDKPEDGRTPQHQAFWQSMPDKEADA